MTRTLGNINRINKGWKMALKRRKSKRKVHCQKEGMCKLLIKGQK